MGEKEIAVLQTMFESNEAYMKEIRSDVKELSKYMNDMNCRLSVVESDVKSLKTSIEKNKNLELEIKVLKELVEKGKMNPQSKQTFLKYLNENPKLFIILLITILAALGIANPNLLFGGELVK